MKYFLLSFLLSLSFLAEAVPGMQKWHTEKVTGIRRYPSRNDGTSFFGVPGSFPVNPGDTVALRNDIGEWGYVALIGYSGTALNPIVIVNEGAGAPTVLRKGFGFESVRFLKVVGNTVPGVPYGFYLNGYQEYSQAEYDANPSLVVAKQGFNITLFSSDIEASWFKVRKGTYGVECKNDPSADPAVNAWVLSNMYFHHFEMHDLGSQGFYMGNTDPENFSRPIGDGTRPKPSVLSGLRISNGLIDSTGRGGLQISGHEIDNAIVDSLTIRHSGTQLNNQQGANISIGGNTKVIIRNSVLSNSYTWSVSALGSLYFEMYNVTVDSTGWLSPTVFQTGYAPVALEPRLQKVEYGIDSSRFLIYNNTFGRSVLRENNDNSIGDISIYNGSTQGQYYFYSGNCISGNTNFITEGAASVFSQAGVNYSTVCAVPPTLPSSGRIISNIIIIK